MILLLCTAVGVFGVSCTGDDGEAGPPGPPGPPGPGADEIEIPEDTNFYGFLKSWGSETGEIACSDSLLTGMGPLPGPPMALPSIRQRTDDTTTTAVNEAELNVNIAPTCGENFGTVAAADLPLPGVVGTTAVVLFKSGRSAEDEESVEENEPTSFSKATRVTTTKRFVEGLVFAELADDGTGESLDRELLYSDCVVGTQPPSIRGIWRAVRITEKTQEFDPVQRTGEDDATVQTKVTRKICVQLDSHPGATKCYVETSDDMGTADAADDEATRSVALYDGADLTEVVAQADLADFASSPVTANLFADGTGDITDARNLCYLFGTE